MIKDKKVERLQLEIKNLDLRIKNINARLKRSEFKLKELEGDFNEKNHLKQNGKVKKKRVSPEFYKYLGQCVFLKFIRNKKIKATNPIDFNDPIDSKIPNISADGNKWKKLILKELKINREFKNYLIKHKQWRDFNESFARLSEKANFDFKKIEREWCKLISNYRIVSLTKNRNDVLMWSHYADEHRGVAIQFKSNLSLGEPQKVDYYSGSMLLRDFIVKMLKFIIKEGLKYNFAKEYANKISDIATEETITIVEKYFLMKMSEWSYENEYRLIYDKENEKIEHINDKLDLIKIEGDDISSIILGANISPLRAKRLKLIINKKFPNVKVKQCYFDGWELKQKVL